MNEKINVCNYFRTLTFLHTHQHQDLTSKNTSCVTTKFTTMNTTSRCVFHVKERKKQNRKYPQCLFGKKGEKCLAKISSGVTCLLPEPVFTSGLSTCPDSSTWLRLLLYLQGIFPIFLFFHNSSRLLRYVISFLFEFEIDFRAKIYNFDKS